MAEQSKARRDPKALTGLVKTIRLWDQGQSVPPSELERNAVG